MYGRRPNEQVARSFPEVEGEAPEQCPRGHPLRCAAALIQTQAPVLQARSRFRPSEAVCTLQRAIQSTAPALIPSAMDTGPGAAPCVVSIRSRSVCAMWLGAYAWRVDTLSAAPLGFREHRGRMVESILILAAAYVLAYCTASMSVVILARLGLIDGRRVSDSVVAYVPREGPSPRGVRAR